MDRLSLLQGIFLTQESNQGLLHCRWILYQLSYEGSPYNQLVQLMANSKSAAIIKVLYKYYRNFVLFYTSKKVKWFKLTRPRKAPKKKCDLICLGPETNAKIGRYLSLGKGKGNLEKNDVIKALEGIWWCLAPKHPKHWHDCHEDNLNWDLLWKHPRWISGKESTCQYMSHRFNPIVGKIPWRRKWQPCLLFLPGNSHRQRSLAGYSPWSLKEPEITEHVEMKATNVNTKALKKQFKIRRCKFQRTIGRQLF